MEDGLADRVENEAALLELSSGTGEDDLEFLGLKFFAADSPVHGKREN